MRCSPWAAVLGGLWADVDLLAWPVDLHHMFHRTVTHSVAFAVASAVVVGLLARRRRWAWCAGFLVGGLLHLAADACFDTNPANGIGVMLWWPWSQQMIGLVDMPRLMAFIESGPATGHGLEVSRLLVTLGAELPFVAIAGWSVLSRRRRQAGHRLDRKRQGVAT